MSSIDQIIHRAKDCLCRATDQQSNTRYAADQLERASKYIAEALFALQENEHDKVNQTERWTTTET